MTEDRIFPDEHVAIKAEDYHGTAHFERAEPDLISQEIRAVNVEIPFEEALKLSLALQSCLVQLNRYHRGTVAGREMGVLLSFNTESRSIAIIEKRVHPGR